MAKKLVAVTGIKHNGDFYEAGSAVDPSKFSREELKELHDNGALVIEDSMKAEEMKAEEPATPEAPVAPKDTTVKK